MTEVFLVQQDRLVLKEIMVLLVLLVLLVHLVHLDYLVPLVPKELKGLLAKQDQREKQVHLDPLVHLVLLATSFTLCLSRPLLRAEHAETLMPVR